VCWRGICWMNPPFGATIWRWVAKAYRQAQSGATVVCLLPARTDTRWWHDFVMRAHEIRFISRRVVYVGAGAPAPFPSVLVVFRPGQSILRVTSWYWSDE
jgi:site-specific DNA-methyltransferase (adenine-specific)